MEHKDEKSVTLPPLTEEEKKQVQERFKGEGSDISK